MRTILVLLVDDLVIVAVDELPFQRLTLSIVLLLIEEEGTRCVTYRVDLCIGASTSLDMTRGYTLVSRELYSVKLRDLGAVRADIVGDIPRETLGLDRSRSDAKLEALTLDVTHVGEDTVREV